MIRVRRAIAPVVLAGGLVWACGGGGGGAGPMDPDGGGDEPPEGDVVLNSASFQPEDLTVSVGTTVVWVNALEIFHTITPDGHMEWNEVEVDQRGETFQVTFDQAGTFEYFCTVHGSPGAGMHGTITVTE